MSEISKEQITNYSSHFAMGNLSAFIPHSRGETLSKKEVETPGFPGKKESWRNVSEHCLVAGIFADIIAEEVGLSGDERKRVVKAAIMHDSNKKYEILEMKEAKKKGRLDLTEVERIHDKQDEILREIGIDEELIHLSGANVPMDLEGPKSMSEKIIWYVDAMLLDTLPVPIVDRFANTSGSGDERKARNTVFSDAFKEKYGGKSLNEVQLELSEKIGSELGELMGYEGDLDKIPEYLIGKFNERVRSYSNASLE